MIEMALGSLESQIELNACDLQNNAEFNGFFRRQKFEKTSKEISENKKF